MLCPSAQELIENDFFKAIKVLKDIQGPKMHRDSMLVPKNILQEYLKLIKKSFTNEFENLTYFIEE